MSLEEARDSAPSSVVATTDAAPSEAAKPVRRRRTTKADAEQPTLIADVSVADSAEAAPAKKVTKRAPRRTAATTETAAPSESAAPAVTSASIESAPTPVQVVQTRDSAPVQTPVSAPIESAPAPVAEYVAPSPGSFEGRGAPAVDREPMPREDNSNEDGATNGRRFGNRFNPRPNGGEASENGFQSRENGAPRDGNAPREPQEPRGDGASSSDGDGANANGERPFDAERPFENRTRFSRGGRNQLRRERNGGNPNERNQPGERPERNNGERGERPERGERGERGNRNNRFAGPNGGDGGGFGPSRRREYEILALQNMEMPELLAVGAEFNLESPPEDKDALIYAVLEAQAHAQNAILKRGTLEILSDGKGFLRCEGYLPADGDVYVSQSQIKRFNLKTGDLVLGTVRTPKEMERFHGLLRVEAINGLSPEEMKTRKDFEKLTPIFPTEKFVLETEPTNITARIIDLVSPIGKGSRGLIVAPPKAGKTTLIKNIANSIAQNHPEVVLIVLLIDERPEEVTDISRSIRGEVVASTFDEMPDNHMRVADIVMEKAKRLVEMKQDVVILMDSITRLSRASNLVVTPSGRTLSGGLDPAAMYRPKRMFGAARNIEEGGSLTILATALVDTGSRMDEMIFEEFKGTGNLDLVLDRNLFDQRIFPAIDINRSGTRRDDLLLGKEDLATVYHLRRTLAQLDNDKAVTLLIDRLKNTKSNLDFMNVVAKSARNTGQGAG